ncbi:MAG: c-type cytochrome [Gammaproteobacteria bacterium]|nr:c-type cytochrome [Gammaproteobacteria bacterium]
MIWRYGTIILLTWLLVACEDGKETATIESIPTPREVIEKPLLVGDVEAGKALAADCATCHGMDGVLAQSGSPFIAGLEQDYLIRSLLAYADGSRKHDKMKAIVDALGPDKLADVSAYYAQLDTPWRGAVRSTQSKLTLQDKQTIAAGAKLAERCNSCHGADGNAARSDVVPRLAGMSLEYFIPAMESYFNGKRQHGIMKLFKTSTNERDIHNLAAYYATRTPKMAPPSRHHKADPAAGKVVAATACAGCHGYDGNSLNPYMPNLAGQPMEYLIKATKDYRDGRRKEVLMQEPVNHLSNKTIANIAAYYAHQRPQTPLSEGPNDSGAFDPLADGAKIAASCNGCHGDRGNSQKAGVPSLTGLHEKYLVTVIKAYQRGTRQHDLMRKLVSHFSDTDIEKVSFYYALQEPGKRQNTAEGDPAAGHRLSESCAVCHGEGGISKDPFTPSLAGQDARYLVHATQAYASGVYQNDKMQAPAQALSETEIRDLSAYYAAQPPQRSETWPPEPPQFLIKERCDRCHGERGFSTHPGNPRLAGQSEAYLILAMQEYQDGTRTSQTMHAMADVLSLLEIKAVAAYYARQTADGEENSAP